jgi:hypothetical protein
MTSIFKIKFSKNSDCLNDDYDRLAEYEKDKISNISVESFFDYDDDDDRYNFILITTHIEIEKYISILENNLIWFDLENLSHGILKGEIDLEYLLKDKYLQTSLIKFNTFIESINYWILDNTDIDIVLDRISQVGMNNLKEVERDYLKNYKI